MVNEDFVTKPLKSWAQSLHIYLQKRMIALLLLGIASGLPLALTGSTFFIWLAEQGVEKAAIGMFALLATPYSLKFLWAPLVDGIRLPLLGRLLGPRRSWLLVVQLALMAALVGLGLSNPAANPWHTAWFALLVAFASATQDIVIDAYRVELLPQEEQGAGAAVLVLGYRLGMLVSTAGALYLSTYYGWAVTYSVMALVLPVGLLAALWAGEPRVAGRSEMPAGGGQAPRQSVAGWMRTYIVGPFREFMQRPHWLWILLFILLYKLPDAFMGVMTGPFYLDQGYSKIQIADTVKLFGVIATLVGGVVGGLMVARLSVMQSLWVGGLLAGGTNLLFLLLAQSEPKVVLLAVVVCAENLASGISAAAFVAFISRQTNLSFTATQFALLSSLAAVGRTLFSAPAGVVADDLGWSLFFIVSTLLAVPGLWVLAGLMRKTKKSYGEQSFP